MQPQEGGRPEEALKYGADALATYDGCLEGSLRRMPGQKGISKRCTVKNAFEAFGPRTQSGIRPGLSGFQLGGGKRSLEFGQVYRGSSLEEANHKSQPLLTESHEEGVGLPSAILQNKVMVIVGFDLNRGTYNEDPLQTGSSPAHLLSAVGLLPGSSMHSQTPGFIDQVIISQLSVIHPSIISREDVEVRSQEDVAPVLIFKME
ncbi:hypothetical protein STEG23_032735 [Scotinomys teguina]